MIDSHAHLDMEAFDLDREEVLNRAEAAGVGKILSLALIDEEASYEKSFAIVEGSEMLWTAVGCTPHDAKDLVSRGNNRWRSSPGVPRWWRLARWAWTTTTTCLPRNPKRRFRRQIRVARRLGLPLIIHHREAEEDLVSILDEEKASEVGGVLHSFTAGRELARAGLERGFHISFSGILTFRNAEALREVGRDVPMDRILVETDCPYLAPVPNRGKRNEPAFVRETARVLAELKGVSIETVERVTDDNFRRVFKYGHR